MSPQKFTARFEDKIVHNEKFTQYAFELVEPNEITFQAGQYVSVQVDDLGTRRSYSICSTPDIQHGFELLIDLEPQGIGSKFFQNLEYGQQISFLGPLGNFTIAPDQSEAIVFVATGSGVAPFRSMILDLLQVKKDPRPMILYWGLRYAQQMFWQDEFEELAENFPNFKFHPVLSKPSEDWVLCSGRVTDCLSVHSLPEKASYYLCGNKQMVLDTTSMLQSLSVKPENIHHEKFY